MMRVLCMDALHGTPRDSTGAPTWCCGYDSLDDFIVRVKACNLILNVTEIRLQIAGITFLLYYVLFWSIDQIHGLVIHAIPGVVCPMYSIIVMFKFPLRSTIFSNSRCREFPFGQTMSIKFFVDVQIPLWSPRSIMFKIPGVFDIQIKSRWSHWGPLCFKFLGCPIFI